MPSNSRTTAAASTPGAEPAALLLSPQAEEQARPLQTATGSAIPDREPARPWAHRPGGVKSGGAEAALWRSAWCCWHSGRSPRVVAAWTSAKPARALVLYPNEAALPQLARRCMHCPSFSHEITYYRCAARLFTDATNELRNGKALPRMIVTVDEWIQRKP